MLKNELKDIFTKLYKNIVIILLVATASVVLSVGYVTMYSPAAYVVKGEVLVHNGHLGNFAQTSDGVMGKNFIGTCERLFNSQAFFIHLQKNFLGDRNYSVEELDDMINVKAEGKHSLFMKLSVVCDDPEEASYIAENCIYALGNYSRRVTSSVVVDQVQLDEEASLQKPAIIVLIIISLISGALVGSLLVLFFEIFNRKVKNAADYEAKYQVRLLGVVPNFEANKKEGK